MKNYEYMMFSKFVCLAQKASDAGKYDFTEKHNNKKAVKKGYSIKEHYINKAIFYAKKCKNITVGSDEKYMGWKMGYMTVIYFTIINVGQVSFHCYLPDIYKDTYWRGNEGESARVCKYLSKRFNLQVY